MKPWILVPAVMFLFGCEAPTDLGDTVDRARESVEDASEGNELRDTGDELGDEVRKLSD